ncbi:LysR family transcriptional regulator [Microbulbifer sp.]|uniref:LysR family transcriptional regulator n=1 Tax=Microbulbifer sp. TaxID=1908541 RepID=UPI002590A164|nr:LysR family transcriptional regulator [Microbulbifer sp.]
MSATIKQLRAFVTVAATRSLADASAELHISQPALSIAIRNLEEIVGGPLFNREGRQLTLTPEGERFATRAAQLLHNWDRSIEEMQRHFTLERGHLTLAAIPAFALNRLPPLLAEFHHRHPQVDLALEDIVMEQVIQAVRNGRAEIGLTFRPDDLAGLEFTPLEKGEFHAVLPSDHPLAKRRQLQWADLATQPFVAMNHGSAVRRWTDQAFADSGGEVRLLCEAYQLSTIGQLVKVGMGVSAMPSLCAPQMEEFGLRSIPLTAPAVTPQLGVIFRSLGGLSAPAQAFLKLLQDSAG